MFFFSDICLCICFLGCGIYCTSFPCILPTAPVSPCLLNGACWQSVDALVVVSFYGYSDALTLKLHKYHTWITWRMQFLYLPHRWVPPDGWSLALDEPPILRVSHPHGGGALLVEVVQVGTDPKLEAMGTSLEDVVCVAEQRLLMSPFACIVLS